MKRILSFLILLPVFACVSSKNIAETRNAETAYSNRYEMYQLWRNLDITRFTDNIAGINVALIADEYQTTEPDTTDQVYMIYNYLKNEIVKRDSGFSSLKAEYFNAPDSEKTDRYMKLKSDQNDQEFLSSLENNPYFDLYKNMETKTRQAIMKSRFYSSQDEFENYLNKRSFSMVKQTDLAKIMTGLSTLSDKLSEEQKQAFLSENINFLILISSAYNLDYSDRAQDHVGSDKISLKLINVESGMQIAQAEIVNYWGDE